MVTLIVFFGFCLNPWQIPVNPIFLFSLIILNPMFCVGFFMQPEGQERGTAGIC